MYKCLICNLDICNKGFGSHIKNKHNMNGKEYYDLYLKRENENICPVCGKETPFLKISKGYQKHCSISCSQKDKETLEKINKTRQKRYGITNFFQNKDIQHKAEINSHSEDANIKKEQTSIKHYGVSNPMLYKEVIDKVQQTNLKRYGSKAFNINKAKKTMLGKYGYEYALQNKNFKEKQEKTEYEKWLKYANDNNLLLLNDVLREFGTGWYQSKLGKSIIITVNNRTFVSKNDLDKIINYNSNSHTYISNAELELRNFIQSFYHNKIIFNSRRIIGRAEIDIYLPDLQLAVEYNGNYWHSSATNTPINYHLRKSILCRNKGIRLIHIYEFENFEKQKLLLKDLILGKDNYPKNDFNKNNLIEDIPKAEIVYKNDYTIYGAGKLY